jgi:hypothetical protein
MPLTIKSTGEISSSLFTVDSDGDVINAGELQPTTALSATYLNVGQIGGRRNMIINGAMQVAQRGTSATTMTNAYATVDRVRGFSNGSGAFTGEQYSMSNAELATTGHSKALKILVSTADTSIDAADYYALQQKFEGDDLQHLQWGTSNAKTLTISFWVKSDTTGTYFLTVDKIANGGTAYRLPQEYTINSANTWEYKTITISPTAGSTSFITSSAGAIGGGTGHGLSLYFGFAWGTDYHGVNNTWGTGSYGTNATVNGWMSTVGNDFYITGVQLEVGSVATPFEHRSFGEELALCQRYYYQWNTNDQFNAIAIGMAEQSNELRWVIPFHTEMRAKPAQSLSAAGDFTAWDASHSSDLNTRLAYYAGKNSAFIRYNANTSGFTIGRALVLYAASNTNAAMKFDAEL